MKISNFMDQWKKGLILFILGLSVIFVQTTIVKSMNEDEHIIYKILTPAEWEAFEKSGSFTGSGLDKETHFIHAAFKDQYPRLIEKYFQGIRPIVLVTLDRTKLKDILKVEANKPEGEKYPHIYGPIPFTAVIGHEVIK